MGKDKLVGNIMLIITTLIWGSAFVAQSVGMEHVGVFTFLAGRSLLACIVLAPAAMIMDKLSGKPASFWGTNEPIKIKKLLYSGALCGVLLMAASLSQQAGIAETTVGKAGFLTAMYIIIIPVAGLFFGKKLRFAVWVSVGLALIGMYLLCMNGESGISRGDLLVLLSALLFSGHITVIDKYAKGQDGVRLSFVQFMVLTIVSMVFMFIFEKPTLSAISGAVVPILYAGVLSSGVAYTLQILAQQRTDPVVASLLMSLEAVFATISGWLILGETLSLRELMGTALMFSAIILAQLPGKKKEK